MAKSEAKWDGYQRLVVSKLDDHSRALEALNADIKAIRVTDVPALQVEIGALKVKAGMWGAMAGLVPTMIFAWFSKK